MNQPDLVLFVGEALVGNEAVDQLVKFNQSLADHSHAAKPRTIDGIVLTKFDTIDDKVSKWFRKMGKLQSSLSLCPLTAMFHYAKHTFKKQIVILCDKRAMKCRPKLNQLVSQLRLGGIISVSEEYWTIEP